MLFLFAGRVSVKATTAPYSRTARPAAESPRCKARCECRSRRASSRAPSSTCSRPSPRRTPPSTWCTHHTWRSTTRTSETCWPTTHARGSTSKSTRTRESTCPASGCVDGAYTAVFRRGEQDKRGTRLGNTRRETQWLYGL